MFHSKKETDLVLQDFLRKALPKARLLFAD